MSRKSTRRGKRPVTLAGGFASDNVVTRKVTEQDPDGVTVTHHRTVDTIRLMLEAGTITEAMHDAARDFQAAFTIANLDRMPGIDWEMMIRPLPGSNRQADLSDTQVGARERVSGALEALGGYGSPAGSCVWFVVGLQTSIREWAIRQGWGGRPVRQESAQGILVAALGVLAKHYGYRDRGQRRCA
ncbi:MAG TPA: DUF6456 domain-containing protein [Bauldia sp.]|nr:DUF6456 domain-containing protein [Bauldia sp.]